MEKRRTEENPYRTWLRKNPHELPTEIEDEARMHGFDSEGPEGIEMIRSLLMDDPDMFGDWDAYQ